MKINKSRQIMFFVSLIGIIVVTLIMGTTFAYQTFNVEVDYKDGSDNDTLVEAGKLNISFESNNKLDLKNMPLLPDYKTADYKEFTIKTNDTSYDVAYQINFKNLEYSNEMISDSFKYTITLVEDDFEFVLGEGDFSALSGTEINLPFNLNTYRILEKGKNETLRLYLWLKESNDAQNLEKTYFKGNIEIVSLFSNEVNETIYKTFKINGIKNPYLYECKRAEYIESDGNQYINLEYPLNNQIDFEMKLAVTENPTSSKRIFGGYYTGSKRYELAVGTKGIFINYASSTLYTNYIPTLNEPFVISKKGNALYSPEGQLTMSSNIFDTKTDAYLFAANRADTEKFVGRIYYMDIYESDSLINSLIPCYRKSDSAIGMYDLINKYFYENSGTGEFILGNIEPDTEIYDETSQKYKMTITQKLNNEIYNTYDIFLDEPLRKLEDKYDYIDLVNRKIVRYIKEYEDYYEVLDEPIYEEIGSYNIPYIENSTLSTCDLNNACVDNVEVEFNK